MRQNRDFPDIRFDDFTTADAQAFAIDDRHSDNFPFDLQNAETFRVSYCQFVPAVPPVRVLVDVDSPHHDLEDSFRVISDAATRMKSLHVLDSRDSSAISDQILR